VALLSHPFNWIMVVLILAMSLFALCVLAAPLEQIGGLVQVI
jgi:hypothetical protein